MAKRFESSPLQSQPGAESTDKKLTELRELILGAERLRLARLERRLEDRSIRAQDLSEVLAEAFSLRASGDRKLGRAMTPAVEEVLRASVKRNPKVLVDALFPVMAPAIRKAIGDALRRMVQTLNRTLENSLSVQGLKWRLESWRTGRPLGEVVLLHSLEFRVEQVFLIHRESGLLIEHLQADSILSEDPDLVSGMLTAIRDFVRDSFSLDESEGVQEMQVGELSIWIEQGPYAVLALVIRGNPPEQLREVMQVALERLHAQYQEQLQAYGGDASQLMLEEDLEACLQERLRVRKQPTVAWLVAAAVTLAVLILLGWNHLESRAQARKWEQLVTLLNREPGIVVTSLEQHDDRYHLSGLRDPLAEDPARLMSDVGLAPEEGMIAWEPYLSVHPDLLIRRAEALLRPPQDVELGLQEGRLVLSGIAPTQWILEAPRLASSLPGVLAVDIESLRSEDLERLKQRLEGRQLTFQPGRVGLEGEQLELVEAIAQDLRHLFGEAQALGVDVRVHILGHADPSGSGRVNQQLSQQRAEETRSLLIDRGLPPAVLRAAAADVMAERMVTLQVDLSPAE